MQHNTGLAHDLYMCAGGRVQGWSEPEQQARKLGGGDSEVCPLEDEAVHYPCVERQLQLRFHALVRGVQTALDVHFFLPDAWE